LIKTTMKHFFLRVLHLTLLSLISTCAVGLDVLAQMPEASTNRTKRATFDRDAALAPIESAEVRTMRVFALRLSPGQDLRQQIELFVKEKHIRAGFILTTVGSLPQAAIRLADQQSAAQFDGKFEIVSLVGTLSQDGVHLHISISDSTGKTVGGHLVEGCLIYPTAEIVIGDARGLIFSREKDSETGYQELRIRKAKQ
jgi:predicted DNA-binding protein with PD1-like motif